MTLGQDYPVLYQQLCQVVLAAVNHHRYHPYHHCPTFCLTQKKNGCQCQLVSPYKSHNYTDNISFISTDTALKFIGCITQKDSYTSGATASPQTTTSTSCQKTTFEELLLPTHPHSQNHTT